MSEQTLLDMDALMDGTLDSVPDVPDYMNPPDGLYRLVVAEAKLNPPKEKGKAARFVITHKVLKTVECEGNPVPDNTLFTEGFMGTEDGLKYFKKQAMKILDVSDLNGVAIREVLASLKDVEFDAIIKNTSTKDASTGKEYENCNVRVIPPQVA